MKSTFRLKQLVSASLIVMFLSGLSACSGGGGSSGSGTPDGDNGNGSNAGGDNGEGNNGGGDGSGEETPEPLSGLAALLERLHPPLTHTLSPGEVFISELSDEQNLYFTGQVTPENASKLIRVNASDDTVTVYSDLPGVSSSDKNFIPERSAIVRTENSRLFLETANERRVLSGEEQARRYWLSPDNSKVLFTANYEYEGSTDTRVGLYVSDVASGSVTRLSQEGSSRRISETSTSEDNSQANNGRPRFLPDMSRVLYIETVTTRDEDNLVYTRNLHSVNPDGTDDRVLVSDLTGGESFDLGRVFAYAVTPDGQKIIYYQRAEGPASNRPLTGIYAMNTDGSGKVKLSPAGDDQPLDRAPVYISNTEIVFPYTQDGRNYRLYRNSLNGDDLTDLTGEEYVVTSIPPLVFNGSVYYSGADSGLYSVNLQNGVIAELNTDIKDTTRIPLIIAAVPGQSQVAFVAQNDSDSRRHLYITRPDGSTDKITRELMGTKQLDSDRKAFIPSGDGQYIAYHNQGGNEDKEVVYLASSVGSDTRVISPESTGSDIGKAILHGWYNGKLYFSYSTASRGRTTAYVYNPANGERKELLAGLADFIDEDAEHFVVGERRTAVFSRDAEFKSRMLYLNGGNAGCEVALEEGERVIDLSSRRLFMPGTDQFVFNLLNKGLFYADNNCSRTPITLDQENDNLFLNPRMKPFGEGFLVSNSAGVLARVDAEYSVTVLNDAAQDGVEIDTVNYGAFQATPDGSKVLYWSDANKELYVAPINGGANVRVTPDDFRLFTNQTPNEFTSLITSDSQYAIYPAVSINDRNDWRIFRTSLIDGTTTELADNVSVNHSAYNLVLSDDESTVFFLRSDAERVNRLMSVPVAGDGDEGDVITLSNQFDDQGLARHINGFNNAQGIDPVAIELKASNKLIYMAVKDIQSRLFLVDPDGTGTTELTENLSADLSVTRVLIDDEQNNLILTASAPGSTGLYKLRLNDRGIETLVAPGVLDDFYHLPGINSFVVTSQPDSQGQQTITVIDIADSSRRSITGNPGRELFRIGLSPDEQSLILNGDVFTRGVKEVARLPLSHLSGNQ